MARAGWRAGSAASAARPPRRAPAAPGRGGVFRPAHRRSSAGARRAAPSRGQREAEGHAAGGARFSAAMRPPCAVDDGAADGEPEAEAAAAPRRARGRTSRTRCSSSPGRQARARRRRPRPPPRRPRRAARDLDGASGRRVLGRVLEQVDQHLLDQRRVDRHQRQVGGQRDRRRAVPPSAVSDAGQRRAHQLLERVPLALQPQRGPTPAASCRAGCPPAGSAAPPPRRSSAPAPRARLRASDASLEQAAGGAGDGRQRRAQVVRHRAQQRAAQALAPRPRTRARSASLGQARALQRRAAIWRASVSSRSSWSGVSGSSAACGPHAQHAQRGLRCPAAARRARPRPGSVSVPRPAGAAVLEDPVGDRPLARVVGDRPRRRAGGLRAGRRASGSSTSAGPLEQLRHVAATPPRHVLGRARAPASSRLSAYSDLRAPLALARRLGLVAHAHGQRADEQATTSITANVTTYCGVA